MTLPVSPKTVSSPFRDKFESDRKSQVYNHRKIIILKVAVASALVIGTIVACIFLEKRAPTIIAAVAGGMSITIASLKLINYSSKLLPANEETKIDNVKQLRKLAKTLNYDEYCEEAAFYQKNCTPAQYYEVFVERVLEGKKVFEKGQVEAFLKKAKKIVNNDVKTLRLYNQKSAEMKSSSSRTQSNEATSSSAA